MDFDQLNITRKTGPIKLEGFHTSSLNPFFNELTKRRTCSTWVFSDLTLGAWRSFQVPYEFALQLGITNSVFPPQRIVKRQEQMSLAENFGKYVDRETLGDFTILKSLDIVNRMISQIKNHNPPTFIIFTPNFGFEWGKENIVFVQFLYYSLNDISDIIIVSTNPDKAKIPSNWKIKWSEVTSKPTNYKPNVFHLIPGIVTPEINKKIERPSEGLLTLNNGFAIISPECRQSPFRASRTEWLEFESKFGEDWLKPYCVFFSDSNNSPNPNVFGYAGKLLDEGSGNIALKIIEKECSKRIPSELKIILQTFLQGIRIALEKFEDLDRIDDPSDYTPPQYKSFLLMSKGWGKVMTNQPQEAEVYFSKARDLLENFPEYKHQLLWLLNISALNRFRMGDIDGALNMEKTIEKQHSELSEKDWQLEYINSINLARIYRRKDDSLLSKKYLVRAFDTVNGINSESDHIYRNFCITRHAFESQKLWDALNGWIRIGLHWASMNAPEALGRRVVSAIIDRRIKDSENIIESVSDAIHNKILELLRALRFDRTISYLESLDFRVSAPVFAKPALHIKNNSEHTLEAFLGHGWSIIADTGIRGPIIANESYENLRHMLFGLLKNLYASKSLNSLQSIIIDDQLGYEIPSTVSQLLGTCLRVNVGRVTVGDTTVELKDKQEWLEESLLASVRECVKSVRTANRVVTVDFKRYLPRATVSNDAAEIIRTINSRSLSVKNLRNHYSDFSHERLMRVLRELEKMKIVKLEIDELMHKEIQELDPQRIKRFS